MKRRLLALALCLCVALAWVPVTARAATTPSDAQAYLDILNSRNYQNSYLIDFDGDGRDELLATSWDVRYDSSNFENASYSVWQGANCLVSDAQFDMGLSPEYAIYTKDARAFLCYGNGMSFDSFKQFYTVSNGAWVQETEFWEHDKPDFETDEYTSSFDINGQEVSEESYNEALVAYQRQYSIHPWNEPKESDVRSQLMELSLQGMKPRDILDRLTYAGDRSKCTMTAAQAEAFADTLEETLRAEQSRLAEARGVATAVALFDTGSDVPALLMSSCPIPAASSGETTTFVWEYLDGSVTAPQILPPQIYIYSDHLLGVGSLSTYSAYPFQDGHINWASSTRSIFYGDGWSIDDRPASDAEASAWDAKWNTDDYLLSAGMGEGDGMLDAETTMTLLRAYAKARRFPSYTYPALDAADGAYAQVLAAAGVSEAEEVRRLAEGLYYVIYAQQDSYRGALVRQVRENGQKVFRLERTDQAPVEQSQLEPLVTQAMTQGNLTLDFGRISRDATVDGLREYLSGLLQNMNAPTPNDPAKSDLAAFVESAVSTLSTQTLNGKKNRLAPDGGAVAALVKQAREVYGALSEVLDANEVALNKAIVPTVRAVWSDVDLSEPCQIDLDGAVADALDGCDLQVLLGGAQTWLRVSADDLRALTGAPEGALRLQFAQEDDGRYALRFLDADGQVIEQLQSPVTISLPAASDLSTVMVSYAGGTDNWGGQYDAATGAISFEARYSGTYQVLENSVAIDDIAGLGEESRAAIAFMVSKGYLSAENGLFRPGDPLSRYEFTQALVGMFFALDREQTCDFPDVDPAGPYYPYVASAQAKGIVNGYDDGTFSGDDPINREQVFALAARTLMDQKGYAAPEDFEPYLSSFADRADLSDWAAAQVALSVREGIAGRGEALLPQANITREQAAVVLYRLFCLLYEVSPVALDVPGSGGSALPVILGVSAAVVLLAAGGVTTGVILHKKRKKKANQQTPAA